MRRPSRTIATPPKILVTRSSCADQQYYCRNRKHHSRLFGERKRVANVSIHDGLVHGDACLYVTRLTTEEVLKDAKGFGIDLEAKGPLWLSSDSETKCDANNLAGLSYSIKEVLRQKANHRIRITFDALSSVLMINQAETVYRFLTQLFREAKQYDTVLLATLEESMHKPEVLASMEEIFDGVIAIKMPSGGSNRRFVLEVREMRGTPFALEMPWETDRVPH